MNRCTPIVLALSLAIFVGQASRAAAQTSQRCFRETGQCIAGRIREFWEQNGGLPVFGYPIAPLQQEQIEGTPLQVQWFERNRLELHPENQRPYDVLLSRLGVNRLAQQGRDWFTFAKSEAQPGCRFFPETGHNVCGAILAAWHTNGLEIDGRRGKSEQENLALVGLPLSDAQTETIAGKEYTVQWFERARFELHPENQPASNVLLGLLGNEIHGPPAPATLPPAAGKLALDGEWHGTTSQGKRIAFTIANNGIAYMETVVDFNFGSCRSLPDPAYVHYYQGLPPIIDNKFAITYADTAVNGTFTSNTSAIGSLHLAIDQPHCKGSLDATWTAQK